jgi:hypothetical protein
MSLLVRGRKPEVPRLRDLDPESIATQVCALLVNYISDFAFCFQPGLDISIEWKSMPPESIVHTSQFGLDVITLVRWAQTGLGDEDEAVEAARSVLPRLCTRPIDFRPRASLDDIDIEPNDEVRIVVVAAIARLKMRSGMEVDLGGLAVLAGISHDRIRHLAGEGQVQQCRRGRVTAIEARRFLEARRVPV